MISFNNIGNLGRLANQMFQYASLKGIARNRGYDFCIPPQNVFGQVDELVKNPQTYVEVVDNLVTHVGDRLGYALLHACDAFT